MEIDIFTDFAVHKFNCHKSVLNHININDSWIWWA